MGTSKGQDAHTLTTSLSAAPLPTLIASARTSSSTSPSSPSCWASLSVPWTFLLHPNDRSLPQTAEPPEEALPRDQEVKEEEEEEEQQQ